MACKPAKIIIIIKGIKVQASITIIINRAISSDPKKASKCEFIISGGTFNFYPKDYIEWFVTCLYYACNIYFKCRNFDEIPMKSLEEEQKINEEVSTIFGALSNSTK